MDKHSEKGFERYGIYEPARTGILIVDPYNDFLHADGKAYYKSKEVIEGVHLLDNMLRVIKTGRELQMKIFFGKKKIFLSLGTDC